MCATSASARSTTLATHRANRLVAYHRPRSSYSTCSVVRTESTHSDTRTPTDRGRTSIRHWHLMCRTFHSHTHMSRLDHYPVHKHFIRRAMSRNTPSPVTYQMANPDRCALRPTRLAVHRHPTPLTVVCVGEVANGKSPPPMIDRLPHRW